MPFGSHDDEVDAVRAVELLWDDARGAGVPRSNHQHVTDLEFRLGEGVVVVLIGEVNETGSVYAIFLYIQRSKCGHTFIDVITCWFDHDSNCNFLAKVVAL